MEKHSKVFMKIAELWAKESYCKRNQVGAVLVKNGEVFAHGYNGTLMGDSNNCEEYIYICPKCGKRLIKNKDAKKIKKGLYEVFCPVCKYKQKIKEKSFKLMTKDGVMHAEQNAILFSARDGKSTQGATMYVTTSPCINCASMIFHAGIKKVVYKNEYKDKRGIELLKRKGVEVVKFNEDSENDLDEDSEIDLDKVLPVSTKDYKNMYKKHVKYLLK